MIVLLSTISFLISQNNTLHYNAPNVRKTSSITSTITTQPTSTIIPESTSNVSPSPSPSTSSPSPPSTPIKQTVEQMIEAFKTATGKQICVCENIFHTFLRDKRTPTPITDIDKKCFELAKQIKATTTTPQQMCTYRDNIFHPPCRGPKLNGSRCT